MPDRSMNYRVSLNTEEIRNQLMALQGDVNNIVNQSKTAVQTGLHAPRANAATQHQAETRAQAGTYRASNVASQNASYQRRAKINAMAGGYQYKPSLAESMRGSIGAGSPPAGVSPQQWQQTNANIAANKAAAGIQKAGGVAVGATGAYAGWTGTAKALEKVGAGQMIDDAAMAGGRGVASAASSATSKVLGKAAATTVDDATMAVARGAGTVGKTLGPMAAALSVGEIPLQMYGELQESTNTYRGYKQTMKKLSPNFVTSTETSRFGGGFTDAESGDVASFLHDFGVKTDTKPGVMQDLVMGGTQIGAFNGASDPSQFKEKFQELASNVKKVTETLKVSLDEGMKVIGQLQSSGINSVTRATQTINQISSNANIAGVSKGNMFQTFKQGSGMASSMGLRGAAGGKMMSNIKANLLNGVKTGGISQAQVAQAGGVGSMTKNIAGTVMQSLQGPLGVTSAAAFANESMTGADPSKIMDFVSSGGQMQDLQQMATSNLNQGNTVQNQKRLKTNIKSILSDILESEVSQVLPALQTQNILKQNGMDINRSNMKLGLKNMGINNPGEYLNNAVDPQTMRARARAERQAQLNENLRERRDRISKRTGAIEGIVGESWGAVLDTYEGLKMAGDDVYRSIRDNIGEPVVESYEEMTENHAQGIVQNAKVKQKGGVSQSYLTQNPMAAMATAQRNATVGNVPGPQGRHYTSATLNSNYSMLPHWMTLGMGEPQEVLTNAGFQRGYETTGNFTTGVARSVAEYAGGFAENIPGVSDDISPSWGQAAQSGMGYVHSAWGSVAGAPGEVLEGMTGIEARFLGKDWSYEGFSGDSLNSDIKQAMEFGSPEAARIIAATGKRPGGEHASYQETANKARTADLSKEGQRYYKNTKEIMGLVSNNRTVSDYGLTDPQTINDLQKLDMDYYANALSATSSGGDKPMGKILDEMAREAFGREDGMKTRNFENLDPIEKKGLAGMINRKMRDMDLNKAGSLRKISRLFQGKGAMSSIGMNANSAKRYKDAKENVTTAFDQAGIENYNLNNLEQVVGNDKQKQLLQRMLQSESPDVRSAEDWQRLTNVDLEGNAIAKIRQVKNVAKTIASGEGTNPTELYSKVASGLETMNRNKAAMDVQGQMQDMVSNYLPEEAGDIVDKGNYGINMVSRLLKDDKFQKDHTLIADDLKGFFDQGQGFLTKKQWKKYVNSDEHNELKGTKIDELMRKWTDTGTERGNIFQSSKFASPMRGFKEMLPSLMEIQDKSAGQKNQQVTTEGGENLSGLKGTTKELNQLSVAVEDLAQRVNELN